VTIGLKLKIQSVVYHFVANFLLFHSFKNTEATTATSDVGDDVSVGVMSDMHDIAIHRVNYQFIISIWYTMH